MTRFIPLSKEEHAELKLKPLEDLFDFSSEHLLPIYGAEVVQLSRMVPIVISRKEKDPAYSLSILCSIGGSSPNVWITPDGKWMGDYVPACILHSPFTMLLSEDNQRRVLCIDEDSNRLGPEGQSLLEGGEPTEFLSQQIASLNSLFDNGKQTQALLDLIDELNLIVPLTINVKREDGEDSTLEMIFRVDEQKLNNCEDETWLKLKHAGAMSLIYGHLISLGHIKTVARLHSIRSGSVQTNMEPLDTLFGEEEGNLNFDGL